MLAALSEQDATERDCAHVSPRFVVAPGHPLQERIRAALAQAGLSSLEWEDVAGDGEGVIVLVDPTALGETAKRLPQAQLVVVGDLAGGRALKDALAAGADGVVQAHRLEDVLGPTLEAVAAGQVAFPRELYVRARRPALSAREKQVLGMVVLGFTNGEIARRLVVTESTVKSHLSSAFRKLGVRSRNEAADLILDPENGLGTGILAISSAEAPEVGA